MNTAILSTKEGDGPLHRNQPATDYNHNQDMLAIAMIRT